MALDFARLLEEERSAARSSLKNESDNSQEKRKAQPVPNADELAYMQLAWSMTRRPPLHLDTFKCGNIPSVFYVPDWITEQEEKELLTLTEQAPPSKWVFLKRRTLQNWGGEITAGGFRHEPLPSWLSTIAHALVDCGVFNQIPNHVLLNKYLAGQGIMAHTDGPAYFPRVAILSMGSHCVMNFFKTIADSKAGKANAVISLFLRPRSLIIFTDDLYRRYFHSIDELSADSIDQEDENVLANKQQASVKLGEVYARTTRVSLTIRIVPVGS